MRRILIQLLCLAVAQPAAADGETESFGKLYASLDVYGDWSRGSEQTVSFKSGGMSPSFVGLSAGMMFTDRESVTLTVESVLDLVSLSFAKQQIGDQRAFAKLLTRWGALSAGRQFTPHFWFLASEIDVCHVGFGGTPYVLLAGGVSVMVRTRSVMYETPRLFGFGGQVMIARDARMDGDVMSGSNDVQARLDFRHGPVYAGVTFVDQRQLDGRRTLVAAGASYKHGMLTGTFAGQRVIGHQELESFVEAVVGLRFETGKHVALGSWGLSRSDDGSKGGHVVGVAYAYLVNTQFAMYTSAAWLENARGSQFDLGTAVAAGASGSDLMAGVRLRL